MTDWKPGDRVEHRLKQVAGIRANENRDGRYRPDTTCKRHIGRWPASVG